MKLHFPYLQTLKEKEFLLKGKRDILVGIISYSDKTYRLLCPATRSVLISEKKYDEFKKTVRHFYDVSADYMSKLRIWEDGCYSYENDDTLIGPSGEIFAQSVSNCRFFAQNIKTVLVPGGGFDIDYLIKKFPDPYQGRMTNFEALIKYRNQHTDHYIVYAVAFSGKKILFRKMSYWINQDMIETPFGINVSNKCGHSMNFCDFINQHQTFRFPLPCGNAGSYATYNFVDLSVPCSMYEALFNKPSSDYITDWGNTRQSIKRIKEIISMETGRYIISLKQSLMYLDNGTEQLIGIHTKGGSVENYSPRTTLDGNEYPNSPYVSNATKHLYQTEVPSLLP